MKNLKKSEILNFGFLTCLRRVVQMNTKTVEILKTGRFLAENGLGVVPQH